MPTRKAQDFIAALHRLEDGNDPDALVSMFSDQAELRNPTDAKPHHGKSGAAVFWDAYRRSFAEIHSEFRTIAESEGAVILEWVSRGRMADGEPFEYEGVSVLELQDGQIRRFRAYYDPLDLGEQLIRRRS